MDQNTKAGGIGFWGLLQIALIVLKLLEKIDWGWFWVLFPITIPSIAGLILLAIYLALPKKKVIKPTKSKWQERLEKLQQERREL